MGTAMAQGQGDSTRINPPECGQRIIGPKLVRKRFLSSTPADQNDFGWHVALLNKQNGIESGSLINSQWVLSRANFSE
jgi:hypothetical protein